MVTKRVVYAENIREEHVKSKIKKFEDLGFRNVESRIDVYGHYDIIADKKGGD